MQKHFHQLQEQEKTYVNGFSLGKKEKKKKSLIIQTEWKKSCGTQGGKKRKKKKKERKRNTVFKAYKAAGQDKVSEDLF